MSEENTLPITGLKTKKLKGAEILYLTRSKMSEPVKKPLDLASCVLFERKHGDTTEEIYIRHPYLSKKLNPEYSDNEYLLEAKKVWETEAYDRIHPTATIIVAGNEIIGKAGNGKGPTFHTIEMCERKKLNTPTGQGYHLCSGVHLPENHSEAKVIRQVKATDNNDLLAGATAYLYGHWWSCVDCSTSLENAGIKKLYVSKEWTRKFLEI